MRIKILMLGKDPTSLIADGQLLRDRGIMVFTSFNLENVPELIKEIKPDLLFFDAAQPDDTFTELYNGIVNSIEYTKIPVIFTLSEDDVYLVTRKRTEMKEKRSMISDNIIDAVKMAMQTGKSKKSTRPSQIKWPGSLQNRNHLHIKVTCRLPDKYLFIFDNPNFYPPVFFSVLFGFFFHHYGSAPAKAGILQPDGIYAPLYEVVINSLSPVHR